MSKCVRCKKHVKLESVESTMDLRTLIMRCGYNMEEYEVPFKKLGNGKFSLRVCKPCRADWCTAIEIWFNMPTDYHDYTMTKHLLKLYQNK